MGPTYKSSSIIGLCRTANDTLATPRVTVLPSAACICRVQGLSASSSVPDLSTAQHRPAVTLTHIDWLLLSSTSVTTVNKTFEAFGYI